jgi:hypothetical protein
MPTKRFRRSKARNPPLSKCEWMFFLSRDVNDIELAAAEDGDMFWGIYYFDEWGEPYRQHRREIEAEWQRRFTPEELAEHRAWILRPYLTRPALPHDVARHERLLARGQNG